MLLSLARIILRAGARSRTMDECSLQDSMRRYRQPATNPPIRDYGMLAKLVRILAH